MISYRKTLPDNVKLSGHLKEQADGYIGVTSLGKTYYIPITKDCKKLFGIKRRGETIEFTKGKLMDIYKFDDFIRTIINSIHLQIRDTIGIEIREELMREVMDKMNNVIVPQIDEEINKRFIEKDRLLGDGK
jgi:hypothetical protein